MPLKSSEHWFEAAASAMVRENVNLFRFTNENSLGLTQVECANVLKTKVFQEVLRTQRNLYYKELANDPSMSKTAAEGMAIYAIAKLIEKGQEDKALNGIIQLAKLKGWTNDSASINIIQDLSAKDIADLRKKFTPITAIPKVSKEN